MSIERAAELMLEILAGTSLRTAAIFAAVTVIVLICRGRLSAARRHGLWLMVPFAAASLPAFTELAPAWRVIPLELGGGGAAPPEAGATDAGAPAPWAAVVGLVWLAGVVIALAPIGAGAIRWVRRRRRSRPLADPEWAGLLARESARLGLRRRVDLLTGAPGEAPMCCGALRPAIIMPIEAASWPHAARRGALAHELAHAARWDVLTAVCSRVVCAVFWFHPLVWLAHRRMLIERERAADDLALRGAACPADYAQGLLQAVAGRAARRRDGLGAAAALNSSMSLESRLTLILSPQRSRATAGGRFAAGCALAGLASGAALASVRTAPAPAATITAQFHFDPAEGDDPRRRMIASEVAPDEPAPVQGQFQARALPPQVSGDDAGEAPARTMRLGELEARPARSIRATGSPQADARRGRGSNR